MPWPMVHFAVSEELAAGQNDILSEAEQIFEKCTEYLRKCSESGGKDFIVG